MLGATVPARGGYHMAFEWGDKWRCECVQFYITPSRTWKVPKLSEEEILKFKTFWGKSKVKEVIAHIPYLVNLAASDKTLWNKSIERVKTELSRADKLGVSLLALHPGSFGNSTIERGVERIILGLNKILEKYKGNAKILLETMAGQGTMIGFRFEQLDFILKKIRKSPSVGICFDIGHLFSAGYDVGNVKGYKKTLSEFNKIIGLEKIGAIHLNDSKSDLGSRVDRHASIGKGKIDLAVFQSIIKDKRFQNIPKLLELKENKIEESLKILRKLYEN